VGGAVAASTPIPTGDTFPGVIRVQDVRATEKDKVRIAASFKPGDIVRATVISLGDQSNYYLSTGRNELGVVVARSGKFSSRRENYRCEGSKANVIVGNRFW